MREFPTDKFYEPDPTPPTTPAEALLQRGDVEATMEKDDSLDGIVEAALESMEERDRDILFMHMQGLSMRDIAEMIGTSKDTIHRRLPKIMEAATQALKGSEEVKNYVAG